MATSVLQLYRPRKQTLRKLTIAEYHKLVAVGVLHPKERVELLEGLLVQMAPTAPRHQAIVDQLTRGIQCPAPRPIQSQPWRGQFRFPISTEPQPDMVLLGARRAR
jgi:hypothetical protein